MDQTTPINDGTRISTLGGAFLAILVNLSPNEVFKTAILAAIGAGVSFIVSRLLHRVLRWYKKRKP